MESPGSQWPASWEDPQCPFRIEWTPQKLEEIRIAVVDALYAVPRGGLEIGGVLLGRFDGHLLSIEDWVAMECEHLTGPSFVLSDKDQAALDAQLAALGTGAVGWFHSHTRSEILFSPADLGIHNKFFPGQPQVAMVLRPANMQPLRANYFFRDQKGSVVRGASDFTLDAVRAEAKPRLRPNAAAAALPKPRVHAQPAKPAPPAQALVLPAAGSATPTAPKPFVPGPGVLAVAAPPPRGTPVAQPQIPPPAPSPTAAPAPPIRTPFSEPLREARPLEAKRKPNFVLLAASLAFFALAVSGYLTRESWMAKPPEPLKLQASDMDGKLLIRWTPVPGAQTGQLHIMDGTKNTDVTLDGVQLSQGFYVFARQAVNNTVQMQVDGRQETTSFAGPLSAPAVSLKEPEQKESKIKTERQSAR